MTELQVSEKSESKRHHDEILVSVVIPAKNSLPDLDDQLDSLAKQSYPGPVEVVIADNGSDDGLDQHVREYARKGLLDVRYVDASGKAGPSYARNQGANAARGEFLAFCDADDVVHADWLATLVDLAQESDVVGTAVETDSINTAKALDWTPTSPPETQGKTTFLPFAIGASFGCWASVYRALGGMSSELKASEDVEFCWRAQLTGYTLAFAQKQLVGYRLRDRLVPLIRQSYKLGYGFAQVQGLYRAQGCPPVHLRRAMRWWGLLLLGNPLVPRFLTRVSRGQWLRAVAAHVGEVRGGLKYHTFVW
ncbi:glycosyltransferase [Rhodococcus sp. BP-252]|uniref:glycosyltransferase n=1 Tax=unclassified Rhodococcus (in: high G+C Gram-positive bacteria) TaxID=192944 RepID=UPI001C9A92F2|nr:MULTISPECIES: glycosyltransferase [unclassified Rhodococcus (in: high G+C Gram-positive bacteria)]MBY6410507.1 glycosyltransferase [Rhodococcus sp. BP-320]MBY6417802.1 glycosyltransferase [Rhodococcus sp. BP-321]MBY6422797.1 glycosyltransferase [Rhodococcus sp. BP-324]MBY6425063.1 glycosyltransferase [Rhodococcus sp. BP-323]MBY6439106.1 glycosyltransferase [Rhodococcus sp. BP-319]